MAEKIDNLFNFGRPLPEPFSNVKTKRNTTSKYGTGESTLFSSGMKATLKYVKSQCAEENNGAIGQKNDYMISEYQSSVEDELHLVIYKKSSGNISASIFNNSSGTQTLTEYKLGRAKGSRDGAAIIFNLIPYFLEDEEFADAIINIKDEYKAGFTDIEKAADLFGIVCDNIYRRLKDKNCSAYVPVNIPDVITRISSTAISQNSYSPNIVITGVFKVFTTNGTNISTTTKASVDTKDFEGKYIMNPKRILTEMEKQMIPKLPDYIVVTQEAQKICKLAQATTGKPTQQRNFLLRGGAGSGKTCTAKQIAAGLGLPYVYMTCNPDTTMDELSGVMLPITDDDETSICSEGELKILNDMGGVNPENIAKLLNLPDFDTIEFDPEIAYEKMTGEVKEGATQQECFKLYTEAVMQKTKEIEKAKSEAKESENANNTGTKYRYVESTLLKAIKYGWVVEIQEPTVITRPGVLAGINGIMEQEGKIVLADGRCITRHPDAVVICTTNSNYKGCRGLNESVIDRMSQLFDVETPGIDEMVERAMKVTGEEDENLVRKFASVVNDVADYCNKNDITGGVTGMRVLLDWLVTYQVLGDEYDAALNTVIAKATDNKEDREAIRTTCLDIVISPSFGEWNI